jgi:L-amino acid N-acyltransferase YncA
MDVESIEIRPLTFADWGSVREIYVQGLDTGLATFETSPPSWDQWDASHLQVGRLVAVSGQFVTGWCALSPISKRAAYAGVAEVSVYVGADFRGKGIGRKLLSQLIKESETNGIWTLQASIFPENHPSLTLHESCGFREIGRRKRIAKLNGVWRDTVLIERRSRLVGVD